MVQKRSDLDSLHERMNGLIFDVEYSGDAVKSLASSDEHFNVNSILCFSLFDPTFSFSI